MAEARGSKIMIRRTKDLEPDKLVSFTRLIQALPLGFGSRCYFHGQAGFLFHQKFGNWHAWRFALIFEDIDFEPSPDAYQVNRAIENQIAQRILASEIQQMKVLSKNGKLEWSERTAHIWLQMREVFSLGSGYKYPLDMLMHHYSDISEAYFRVTSNQAANSAAALQEHAKDPTSNDDDYSDDFLQSKSTPQIIEGKHGQSERESRSSVTNNEANIFESSPPKPAAPGKLVVLHEDDSNIATRAQPEYQKGDGTEENYEIEEPGAG